MRRPRNRHLAAGLGAALVLALAVQPADAFRKDEVHVRRGPDVVREYEQIVQDAPMSAARRVDPDECNAAIYCDTIPLVVEVPTDIGPSDDYTLEIVLDWPDGEINNLDMFLWDNMQIKQETPPPGPGEEGYTATDQTPYTNVESGSGDDYPQVIEFARPDLVNYNLTVLNFNGINNGYTVTARISIDEFSAPFESLDPERRPTSPSGGRTATTRPSRSSSSDDDEPAAAALPSSSGGGGSSDVALPPLFAPADPEFGLVTQQPLDDILRAPTAVRSRNIVDEAPGPASGLALVLWLVVLPAAAGAGLATLMVRRRRAAFSFG